MKKKLISLLLILPLILLLCGFLFDKVTVLVDTDNRHVYEYVTADDVLSDFARNSDTAKNKYKDGCYLISGKLESISKTGETVMLTGAGVTSGHIICTFPGELMSKALEYGVGDGIGVYGRISDSWFDNDVHLTAEKITAAPGAVKSGVYYLSDGTSIDKNSMIPRSLKNGKVRFLIPPAWKQVEHSITEEGLGTMEGYQYVLNRLPGSRDNTPEAFFICYFDNISRLENADDKKRTKLIESAIINNISGEGKAASARNRSLTTYYGAQYDYFVGSYSDALNTGANGYHAEYFFHRNRDEGLVMYLYIYRDAKHLSDVMFVTRLLEILKK